jgi:hypothetical protein
MPRLVSEAGVGHAADAELTGKDQKAKSNALDQFGLDFEYKSHRITSKLDVEGSSPFSRSTPSFDTLFRIRDRGSGRWGTMRLAK